MQNSFTTHPQFHHSPHASQHPTSPLGHTINPPPSIKLKYPAERTSRTATFLKNTSLVVKTCRAITVWLMFLAIVTVVLSTITLTFHIFQLTGVSGQAVLQEASAPSAMPNNISWHVFRGMPVRIANVSWSDDVLVMRFTKSSPTSAKVIRDTVARSFQLDDGCAHLQFTMPEDDKPFRQGDTLVFQKVGSSILLLHNGVPSLAKDTSCVAQFACMLKYFGTFK